MATCIRNEITHSLESSSCIAQIYSVRPFDALAEDPPSGISWSMSIMING